MERIGVARQFMDLGQTRGISEKDDCNQVSRSSSGNTRSQEIPISPENIIVESMETTQKKFTRNCSSSSNGIKALELDNNAMNNEDRSDVAKEEDQERCNKISRFNNSRDVHDEHPSSQTLSMIRKARVSVRARSEATMVSINVFLLFVISLIRFQITLIYYNRL